MARMVVGVLFVLAVVAWVLMIVAAMLLDSWPEE